MYIQMGAGHCMYFYDMRDGETEHGWWVSTGEVGEEEKAKAPPDNAPPDSGWSRAASRNRVL